MSFETRLQRLEDIVAELEGDTLDLARALALFEEGIACLRDATAELSKAEAQVQRLVERADGTFEVTDLRD
ncbi:MAG TPA: exodeoxyribonuclease VII small subunit [Gemmatimonadaceae bacterium]|nr:exodeoxyribonuclease VII small subunit [Gemmatimonadaceae bacterium]